MIEAYPCEGCGYEGSDSEYSFEGDSAEEDEEEDSDYDSED